MKRNNELRLSRMSVRSGAGTFETTITHGLGADSARRESQRGLHARTLTSVAPAETGSGVGLWIDHRNAVIVFVTTEGVNTTMVLSRTEKQPGRIGGRRSTAPFEPQLVPADDSQARRYTGQLDLYYDAVIACLREAQSILAFGPGEARDELRRRLALNKHDHRSFVFEVADKMTRRQIEAKTMEWFDAARLSAPAPRRRSGRPGR
jgi:hypothetical protein